MNKPKNPPEDYTTVTPWVIGHNTAGLMDWLKRAFDASHGWSDPMATSAMPRCG
jgi:hypothetical protein